MPTSYGVIVATLREEVIAGRHADAFPTGPELAARFGVSEGTVIRAVSQLRSEGLVRPRSGRGTIVNPVPVISRDAAGRQRRQAREASGSRGAFDAELRAAGLQPITETEPGRAVPPPDVAELLGLPSGAEAVYRRRRMLAGTEPLQLATSWIPADIADGTPIASSDPGPGGIYSRLADAGYAPAQFTEEVRVRVPDDDEISMLSLDPDHRVYVITRTAADGDGRAVEANIIVMPTHQWILRYTWPAER
jgi:GntR family transcriptional regulator